MLVRGVIDHQLGYDAHAPPVRFLEKQLHILKTAVRRMNIGVVGDVIPVVFKGGGVKRQQPDRIDARFLQIVQLLNESGKIADAVPVAVIERLNVDFIEYGVLIPKAVALHVGIGLLIVHRLKPLG